MPVMGGHWIGVDRDSEVPVYEQIARQVRERVAAGELGPGFALPAVRTLASDLGVNLNTVARAYRLLADEGFVRIRDRSGVEVLAPAGRASPIAEESFREELGGLLARMKQAGLPVDSIRRLAESEISALNGRAGKEVESP